ncbi:type VI secretion system lipoprotein TssJ [Sorangium sp. So ce1078]|uniref:type VI secretion system lipoprotein TssJ n=1 Tax=Sorangium sp. So ce1078 TaxID=3133329 RepID=UPI003F5FBB30
MVAFAKLLQRSMWIGEPRSPSPEGEGPARRPGPRRGPAPLLRGAAPARAAAAVAAAALAASLGAALPAAVAGCTSAAPPPAAPEPCDVQIVTLSIYASDNINPNENGNPRPVVVRLYQLKSSARMENATYDQILLKDKETLEDDLAKVDEVEVFPNDLVEVKFERLPDASHLVGAALFHSPKGSSWKTFYEFPLPPGEAQCGGRESDAGPPVADPRVAFFIDSTKIDNGVEFDESMFPNASAVRRLSLPKKVAAPEAPAASGK